VHVANDDHGNSRKALSVDVRGGPLQQTCPGEVDEGVHQGLVSVELVEDVAHAGDAATGHPSSGSPDAQLGLTLRHVGQQLELAIPLGLEALDGRGGHEVAVALLAVGKLAGL
jgi:hypothetical protein